eukprot:scaffold17618_cov18-Tisochrysis_lutea.AAC.3
MGATAAGVDGCRSQRGGMSCTFCCEQGPEARSPLQQESRSRCAGAVCDVSTHTHFYSGGFWVEFPLLEQPCQNTAAPMGEHNLQGTQGPWPRGVSPLF